MMNNLFNAVALVALIGTAFLVPPPQSVSAPASLEPAPVSIAPASAASTSLQTHQPPVPVVRRLPAPPTIAVPAEVPPSDARVPPQDGLDRVAAKTAVEADGYKGVSILGKGANGTWRAKAYRGTTEVVVVVDGAGRVSSE